MIWSFSKLSAQNPIIKPKRLKVIAVSIKKNTITIGWAILKTTNIPAVAIITHPIIRDLVAAAPTNPRIISKLEIGAASNSYMVPENLGKNIPNEAFEIDWVNKVSIIIPGTMKDPYGIPLTSVILEPIAAPKTIK